MTDQTTKDDDDKPIVYAAWEMPRYLRKVGCEVCDQAADEIGRLLEWHHKGRWNIREEGTTMFICRGNHEKHDPCNWEPYERSPDV